MAPAGCCRAGSRHRLLGGVLMWIAMRRAASHDHGQRHSSPLFVPAYAWIALVVLAGRMIGFGWACCDRHRITPFSRPGGQRPVTPLTQRTAILVPIYNEEAAAVIGGAFEKLWHSLAATGRLDAFHSSCLSDTPGAAIAEEEAASVDRGVMRPGPGREGERLFYRRRPRRTTGKKAGKATSPNGFISHAALRPHGASLTPTA